MYSFYRNNKRSFLHGADKQKQPKLYLGKQDQYRLLQVENLAKCLNGGGFRNSGIMPKFEQAAESCYL